MGDRLRILAVDDNPTNLVIVEEILDEYCELRTAQDGQSALEATHAFRPDVVLLDAMMPGMDGYETCRRLREMDSLAEVKIVMMSARAMLEDQAKGIATGADAYLTKPFEEEDLITLLEELKGSGTVSQSIE